MLPACMAIAGTVGDVTKIAGPRRMRRAAPGRTHPHPCRQRRDQRRLGEAGGGDRAVAGRLPPPIGCRRPGGWSGGRHDARSYPARRPDHPCGTIWRARRPWSMCQVVKAETRPAVRCSTSAPTPLVAGQSPVLSAPISSQQALSGRAEPGGRHALHTMPPAAGANHSWGPPSPHRAQESLSFCLPDPAVFRLRTSIRCFFVCHTAERNLAVSSQPFCIFVNGIIQIFFFDLSD